MTQGIKEKTVKVSTKGQLTLPSSIRKDLDIKEGDQLHIYEAEGKFVVIEKSEAPSLEEIQARFQKIAKVEGLTPQALTEAIKESRKRVFKRLYEKTA